LPEIEPSDDTSAAAGFSFRSGKLDVGASLQLASIASAASVPKRFFIIVVTLT
jgi:hypothetical protein